MPTAASIVASARGCWLSLKLVKDEAMMIRSLLIMRLVYLCSQGSHLVNASNRVIAAQVTKRENYRMQSLVTSISLSKGKYRGVLLMYRY